MTMGDSRDSRSQAPPLATEHLDEIVGYRPHARNLPEVAVDEEPYVAYELSWQRSGM